MSDQRTADTSQQLRLLALAYQKHMKPFGALSCRLFCHRFGGMIVHVSKYPLLLKASNFAKQYFYRQTILQRKGTGLLDISGTCAEKCQIVIVVVPIISLVFVADVLFVTVGMTCLAHKAETNHAHPLDLFAVFYYIIGQCNLCCMRHHFAKMLSKQANHEADLVCTANLPTRQHGRSTLHTCWSGCVLCDRHCLLQSNISGWLPLFLCKAACTQSILIINPWNQVTNVAGLIGPSWSFKCC